MQKKFTVPTLTSKTSEESRKKLQSALMGVHGVQKATLYPDTSSFEIEPKPEQKPKKEDIISAAGKAGFKLSN